MGTCCRQKSECGGSRVAHTHHRLSFNYLPRLLMHISLFPGNSMAYALCLPLPLMETPLSTQHEVVGAFKVGTKPALIARTLNIPSTYVQTIIKRHNKTGTPESRPHSGRPPRFTPQTRRAVVRDITNGPRMKWKELGEDRGISGTTVKRRRTSTSGMHEPSHSFALSRLSSNSVGPELRYNRLDSGHLHR